MFGRASDVWAGIALYQDAADAEAAISAPEQNLPWLAETVENWHVLLRPTQFRGETNWFGGENRQAGYAVSGGSPGAPYAVITTAGYKPLPREALMADLPRRLDFARNVENVRAWFASLPGNIARQAVHFERGMVDGMTFTIWRDRSAMMEAAYQPGPHRTQIDRYKSEGTADRTSFTRARIVKMAGSWNGDWNSDDIVLQR
jgi:hypothetical protein